jgi:hypothetical protein
MLSRTAKSDPRASGHEVDHLSHQRRPPLQADGRDRLHSGSVPSGKSDPRPMVRMRAVPEAHPGARPEPRSALPENCIMTDHSIYPEISDRDALVKKISAAMADGKDSGGYDTLLDMFAHIALKVIEDRAPAQRWQDQAAKWLEAKANLLTNSLH